MVERRALSHDRQISYQAYERADGLFDIEAVLRDTKGYDYIDRDRGRMPPGQAVHDIFARVTIDQDMVVRDFHYEMRERPFAFCLSAVDPGQLIGASMRRGWRAALKTAFGPSGGCTHLRELVFGMGTVAFQTLSCLADQRLFEAGGTDAERSEKPFFIGGCHSWAPDSPVVATWFPQFAEPADPEP